MKTLPHPLYGYPLAAGQFLRGLGRCLRYLSLDHRPTAGGTINGDFFGVNVAPGDDPATDDYIVARLAELGIRQVRMDFSYDSWNAPAQRLLDRLLAEGCELLLDLLPPLQEAGLLGQDVDAERRWSQFLARVFSHYGDRIGCFEIGNTPNRGRWSGFSSPSFVAACLIAREQADAHGVRIGGPNVSDFEPLYNASYLGILRALDSGVHSHTDNLFVERVVEPEAMDHRVLGELARAALKLNLVKKARLLRALGEDDGCDSLYCTYTCWTIKRLQRRSAWPEQKRVDYLVRYLALAAASGALDRVYWGPLVCSRDGLIDDGADDYPAVDQVSFYQRIRGDAARFQPTPAFHAMAATVRQLAGCTLQEARHDPEGASIFHYVDSAGDHRLLGWCRDARSLPLSQVLTPEQRRAAQFHSALGEPLADPLTLTEQPLWIALPGPWQAPACNKLQDKPVTGIDHLCAPDRRSIEFRSRDWVGARMLRDAEAAADLASADLLLPEALLQLEVQAVLRDVRNRLWNVLDPRGICEQVTVKLNRVKGFKRLSYRFRPSKGRRHWNNACQMLRRGVPTPQPIAFYEAPQRAGISDSWYLCQFIPDAFSAREVYAAFRDGADSYRGLDRNGWLDLIAGFVCHMHDKQVVHRDLSAGNLLMEPLPDGGARPLLIDIGRARVWSGPGSKVRERHRMLDLIRIAYKLDWQGREAFVRHYEAHYGRPLSPLWRLPFRYYDSKQALKKTLKGKRRQRQKTTG